MRGRRRQKKILWSDLEQLSGDVCRGVGKTESDGKERSKKIVGGGGGWEGEGWE